MITNIPFVFQKAHHSHAVREPFFTAVKQRLHYDTKHQLPLLEFLNNDYIKFAISLHYHITIRILSYISMPLFIT